MKKFEGLFFSDLTKDLSHTQKIAYVAMITAFLVVANMFFEFKFADTQFSITLFACALSGIIIGPVLGFCASFMGDLVGFLFNSGGFMYMPWIGLAMGSVALVSGFVMNIIHLKFKGGDYVKIAIICVLSLLIGTIAINTTAFWIIYDMKKTPYLVYLFARLFVKGQIFNNLFNYALLFGLYPVIKKLIKVIANL